MLQFRRNFNIVYSESFLMKYHILWCHESRNLLRLCLTQIRKMMTKEFLGIFVIGFSSSTIFISAYLCDVTDWTISGSFSDEIPQVGGVMSQPD